MTDFQRPVLPGSGASDYERYLRTDELLGLQKTSAERVHRDELLFQTVHQSSELWLKLAGTEVEDAAALVEEGQLEPALRMLRRAVLCLRYVTDQLDMLNQMDPWEYQEIRVVLGHGSGFDSPGFRRLPALTKRIRPRAGGGFDRHPGHSRAGPRQADRAAAAASVVGDAQPAGRVV